MWRNLDCQGNGTQMKSGYVLTLVMGILLVLSLLITALLQMPGGLRRYAMKTATQMQVVYNAESAILARLYHLPPKARDGLPVVTERVVGPYLELCSLPVCAYAISLYTNLRFADYYNGVQAYRESLRSQILESSGLKKKSGNRRFFAPPEHSYMQVQDGDLRLDFDASVPSANFWVSGDVIVAGGAVFDTLRIYALGNVTLRGRVRARYLEVAAGERVEVLGDVRFRGMVTAQHEIFVGEHAYADYPSVAIAIGRNEPRVSLAGRARFAGLFCAPAGSQERDSSAVLDSGQRVMPAFYGGVPQVFASEVRQ